MSEKELEEFHESLADKDLNFLDSEYTKTTRELVSDFKATGAFLNKWWVLTPKDWSCPVCLRKKREIFHLNEKNYLIGHLHEHHDHMKDVVKELFKKACKQQSEIIADVHSEKFITKIAYTLEAYDNTVICSDCNKADGIAKKLIKTDPNFSFSPNEIAEFIICQPNVEHKIDKNKAREIWLRVKPLFELRMDWANKFAEIAANKRNWYQPSDRTAKQIERNAQNLYKLNGLLEYDLYFDHRYLYKSQPIVGKQDSWRRKVEKVNKAPSSQDLEFLKKMQKGKWEKYDEDWSCPSCKLSKTQCVRKSNKKEWIFEVKSVPLFYKDEYENVSTSHTALCNDCCNTALHIGREVKTLLGLDNIYYPSSFISLNELSELISPRPHSKHEYKNNKIDEILPILMERYEVLSKNKFI